MRHDPATMSDCHLLDEYLIATVYRDGGRRHAEIRAQLESRLAACDAALAEVERAKRALLAGGYTDHGGQDWKPPIGPSAARLLDALDDLREAMELLQAHGEPPTRLRWKDIEDWNTRYGKLLAKHKEAT